MTTTPDPSRLVFVGGLHRSGTTPFSRVLDGHPRVSGLSGTGVKEDEGQHLQTVYPKAKVYGGSGRFAYAPQAHLTEASPLVTSANATSILQAWAPFWRDGADLLVEKSPPNLIMGRFLQALYPGSAFVVVVRHPVAVALSNKKWRRLTSSNPRKFQSLAMMVDHWFTAHDILSADLAHLERVLVVHYEQLVGAPEAELARVSSFLGLDTPIDHTALSRSHGDSYAQKWDDYGSTMWRPGGWQRRLITTKYGERMARFGYDVDDLAGFTAPDGPAGLQRS
ncbi:sulfotransferase [Dermatophilaceae bacterium Soc4.6]